MANTIQLGIDLGTTNSAIVVDNNGKIEIIKNTDQMDYTPSVFGYNKAGDLQVGKKAYTQLFERADSKNVYNYKAEVKRLMGTNETVHFDRVDEDLTAEEISAEILKYLKECALKKFPEINTDGVVITVPAYFTTTQKEATTKAGQLAGFKHVVLLQEPIAGAMSYGFDNEVNENWLVYDLGGGTFDVAIISSKDGTLTVKGHAGDNYLGGKDFDSLIVNKVILPKLEDKYDFSETLSNEKSKRAFLNKLKYAAESAKKALTDDDTTTIDIESLGIVDDNDDDVSEYIKLSREDFEELISKKVKDSIELCKKAIEESGVSKDSINRVILVGGPTQIPYIREQIQKQLGIKVDSSADPLTVVAKGACIFGRSQVIPKDLASNETKKTSHSGISVVLDYESVTSDTDTMVTGIVKGIDEDEDYYVQIQSEDGTYSSNKIKLKNGKFFDNVVVRKGQANQYFLYLSDSKGNIIETDVDSFTITHGVSIAGVPISYSVSVALRRKSLLQGKDEEYCDVLFEKGLTLPVEKTVTYHTAKELKKGEEENVLPIRIYEGESKKPDRNQRICQIILKGTDIPYSLPEGTEVDLTVRMDVSGNVTASAYISDIDYFVEEVGRTHGDEKITNSQLEEDLEEEKERFNKMKEHLSPKEKGEVDEMFDELEEQKDSRDEDTKRKTNAGIKKLKQKLDKFEDSTEGAKLVQEYEEQVQNVKSLARDCDGEDVIAEEFEGLKSDAQKAINEEDWDRLKNILEDIHGLGFKVLFRTPKGLKSLLARAYEDRHNAIDVIRVNKIFDRANEYIQTNDISGMQDCLREIRALMPKGSTSTGGYNLSGITM